MIPIIALLAATACLTLNAVEKAHALEKSLETIELLYQQNAAAQEQKCGAILIKEFAEYPALVDKYLRGLRDIVLNTEKNKAYFRELIEQSFHQKVDTEDKSENITRAEIKEIVWSTMELSLQEIRQIRDTNRALEDYETEEINEYNKYFEPQLTIFLENLEKKLEENNCNENVTARFGIILR